MACCGSRCADSTAPSAAKARSADAVSATGLWSVPPHRRRIRNGRCSICLIGSAKSNIGHCESAAGVAGLTKVLLQMQHQQIVPSLHSAQLNPHIDFHNTPFVVNQSLRPWEQPVIDGRALPRIAGISSFGAGGSNAHMIVEEYQEPLPQPMDATNVLIVLSAR